MTFELKGLEELRSKFNKLDSNLQKKLARGAMRSAMRPMLNHAKSRVSIVSGDLKSSLGITVRRRGGSFLGRVIARQPKGAHAHLVEYGHRLVLGSKRRGTTFDTGIRVPEYPFLTPAFDAEKGEYVRIIASRIQQALGE